MLVSTKRMTAVKFLPRQPVAGRELAAAMAEAFANGVLFTSQSVKLALSSRCETLQQIKQHGAERFASLLSQRLSRLEGKVIHFDGELFHAPILTER